NIQLKAMQNTILNFFDLRPRLALIPVMLFSLQLTLAQTYTYVSTGTTHHNAGVPNSSGVFDNYFTVELGNSSFQLNNTAVFDIKPFHQIRLVPGFKAETFSGAGYAKFSLRGPRLDVASMHPYGYANIPQYSRYELGIVLPDI